MDQSLRRLFQETQKQHGLLTTGQAAMHGLSGDRLAHLVSSGILARMHHGVYRVTSSQDTTAQRALAACLACGKGSAASHKTAAVLWGLVETQDVVEVTVPRSWRVRRRGIVAHRADLGARDLARHGGVPLTRIERTLFDIAGALPPEELEQALDEAFRRGLTHPERLLAYTAGAPGNRKGAGVLVRMARDRAGSGVPESELERRALRLFAKFRFPEPVRQCPVTIDGHTHRIDLAYPKQKVAVELEGRAPHSGRKRWQGDKDRHYRLELDGWRPLYFTWDDVTKRPLKVVLHTGEALGLLPAGWRKG